jgi:hypothetical protein
MVVAVERKSLAMRFQSATMVQAAAWATGGRISLPDTAASLGAGRAVTNHQGRTGRPAA